MSLSLNSRQALKEAGALLMGRARSTPNEEGAYTALSLWWIFDRDRPFIAVVENFHSGACQLFKVQRKGTLSAAAASFDPSELRARLLDLVGDGQPHRFLPVDEIRDEIRTRRLAANRYQGPAQLLPAAQWLYQNGESLPNASEVADALCRDFALPIDAVLAELNAPCIVPGTWAAAFFQALQFIDKGVFRALTVHAKGS